MKKILLGFILGLLGSLAISTIAFAVFQPIKVLPRIRLAPVFNMVDDQGRSLSNVDYMGEFTLYTFFYSDCLPSCAGIFKTLGEINQSLEKFGPTQGIPVNLVVLSFNPAEDNSEKLNELKTSLPFDASNIIFATISDEKLLKQVVGNGFEVYYAKLEDNQFAYDPTFILVDGQGLIRGQYRYQTMQPDSERILRHLGVMADEVEKSIGAAHYAYEAAHLFLCYAP